MSNKTQETQKKGSTQKSKKRSKIILFTQGGMGDVLAATPMVRYFRNEYPDDEIVVVSTYHYIWNGNPNVDVVVDTTNPGDFYTEHVLGQNVRFFKKHFVYDHILDNPAKGAICLPEFICNCYDAKYDGKPTEYYISEAEKRAAKTMMNQTDKEKILLHIYGAVPSDGQGYQVYACPICEGRGLTPEGTCKKCGGSGKIVQRTKTNSLKDLNPEILEPIVEKYSEKFDFLQIGLEGEPLVKGAFDCLGMPLRDTAALIPHCKSFIFIESSFAHIAGALQHPGIVVMQCTSPDFFGYPSAYNVWDSGGCPDWPCNRPVGALMDFLAGYKNPKTRERLLWECPDQKCARISSKKLMKVFEESVGIDPTKKSKPKKKLDKEKQGGKFDSYEEARDS